MDRACRRAADLPDRGINLIRLRMEEVQTAHRGNEDDRAEEFCISGIERDCI